MSRRKAWNTDPEPLLRVEEGFRLDRVDPDSTPGFAGRKIDGLESLAAGATRLAALQERLHAASTAGDVRRVLLVLQAMDTAGKGGIVSHVVGAVDPNGVHYAGFKAPTAEEREHDFLWRIERELPRAGQLGVFDRSHYEDVLIQRVRSFAPPEEIERRYGAIVDFEDDLVAQGTTIVKVMLHISKDEQRERLGDRLDRPDKHWKFNPGDIDERLLWTTTSRRTRSPSSARRRRGHRGTSSPRTASGTPGSRCSSSCSARSRTCSSPGRRRTSTWRSSGVGSRTPDPGAGRGGGGSRVDSRGRPSTP